MNARETDNTLLCEARVTPTAWQRYCPDRCWRHQSFLHIEAFLDEPETRERLEQGERDELYPRWAVDRLFELGLADFYAPEQSGSSIAQARSTTSTIFHLFAMNSVLARRNCSLAITIGVNGLALLPAYVAGTPVQLEQIFSRFREGHLCAMLLTELAHGSNLLRNEAHAEPVRVDTHGQLEEVDDPRHATHFRLYGEKHLINGGIEHGTMVTLMRTRGFGRDPSRKPSLLGERGDFSLFYLARGAGVESLPRWPTLPTRAADISGVRFEGALAPAQQIIGGVGAGMSVIQRTLSVSRGSIAALTSGVLSHARDIALTYASRRNVYGQPIASLAGLSRHLRQLDALDRAVAAISLVTMARLNAHGLGAAHMTAVAKFMGCRLAEEGLTEGQRVLGARSLLRDLPYARLLGDVLLFGVFDGTSHVMLEQISGYLVRQARDRSALGPFDNTRAAQALRTIHATRTQPIQELFRERTRAALLPVTTRAHGLAALPGDLDASPLPPIAEALLSLVRAWESDGCWKDDQALRFEASQALGLIETSLALAELFDPIRRAYLGILSPYAPPDQDAEIELLSNRAALSAITLRAARAVHSLALSYAPTGEAWMPVSVRELGGTAAFEARVAPADMALEREFLAALASGSLQAS